MLLSIKTHSIRMSHIQERMAHFHITSSSRITRIQERMSHHKTGTDSHFYQMIGTNQYLDKLLHNNLKLLESNIDRSLNKESGISDRSIRSDFRYIQYEGSYFSNKKGVAMSPLDPLVLSTLKEFVVIFLTSMLIRFIFFLIPKLNPISFKSRMLMLRDDINLYLFIFWFFLCIVIFYKYKEIRR